MPTHIHIVFSLISESRLTENGSSSGLAARHEFPVTKILGSLKKYTARRANDILRRNGDFWQDESYDHLVRDLAELQRLIWYVLQNPVKAGLVKDWQDWPWNYCANEVLM
jgi:putative transposase